MAPADGASAGAGSGAASGASAAVSADAGLLAALKRSDWSVVVSRDVTAFCEELLRVDSASLASLGDGRLENVRGALAVLTNVSADLAASVRANLDAAILIATRKVARATKRKTKRSTKRIGGAAGAKDSDSVDSVVVNLDEDEVDDSGSFVMGTAGGSGSAPSSAASGGPSSLAGSAPTASAAAGSQTVGAGTGASSRTGKRTRQA